MSEKLVTSSTACELVMFASMFNEKLDSFLGIEGRAVNIRGKFNYWVRLVGG